jgi:hypothetical protein
MEWAAGLVSSAMGRPEPAKPAPPVAWPKFVGTDFECYEGEKEQVPAMSEFTIEINLKNQSQDDVPSSLFYSFATTPQQGFGFTGAGLKGNITFRVDFSRGWGGAAEQILPQAVYQSHLQAVRGELQLPSLRGDCNLSVTWDNTQSLMASKELSYKLFLVREDNIVRAGSKRKQIRTSQSAQAQAQSEPEPEPQLAAAAAAVEPQMEESEGSWM